MAFLNDHSKDLTLIPNHSSPELEDFRKTGERSKKIDDDQRAQYLKEQEELKAMAQPQYDWFAHLTGTSPAFSRYYPIHVSTPNPEVILDNTAAQLVGMNLRNRDRLVATHMSIPPGKAGEITHRNVFGRGPMSLHLEQPLRLNRRHPTKESLEQMDAHILFGLPVKVDWESSVHKMQRFLAEDLEGMQHPYYAQESEEEEEEEDDEDEEKENSGMSVDEQQNPDQGSPNAQSDDNIAVEEDNDDDLYEASDDGGDDSSADMSISSDDEDNDQLDGARTEGPFTTGQRQDQQEDEDDDDQVMMVEV